MTTCLGAVGRARASRPAGLGRQFLGMINDIVFRPRLLVPALEMTPAEAERVVNEAVKTFLARYATRSRTHDRYPYPCLHCG
ncbi:TetR/AcrR family transcriptional regulator C-terminal domain-containing protein [Planotetraspora thailandica]|uniref:TetR/AcrR family transcriptional regulator C-terminal domain-containing protein n=1 Tax=Planotetraspora thailandica TaxID=487172 RepID=UPI00194E5AAF